MTSDLLVRTDPRPTSPSASASSSSAPASPASAPPSSSTSTASPTSSSSTRATPSAAPGATTPTPAPPATCPSQLYSFSFAPNPDWSRSFSPQPEIQAYLERTAARVRRPRPVPLRRHRRGRRLGRGRRRSGTSAPTPAPSSPTSLVTGSGGLSEPKLPEIDGIDSFDGRDLPLRPLEPRLRPHRQARRRDRHRRLGDPDRARGRQAGRAPRRLPAHRPVGDAAQRPRLHRRSSGSRFRHLPFVQKAYRTGIYWGRECFVPGFTVNPKLAAPAKKLALQNIERGITDPALREAVTPDFQIGCKRILISNDYYPALDRDHVDLVTDGIARDHADRASSPPTAPSARSTRSSWPPASTPPSSPSPSTSRVATAAPSPTRGARAA